MTEKEVLSNLCYYDERNPDNVLNDIEDVEEFLEAKKKDVACFCNNCFNGRTILANEITTWWENRNEFI